MPTTYLSKFPPPISRPFPSPYFLFPFIPPSHPSFHHLVLLHQRYTDALVTGANRGLGLAFTQLLAERPDVKIFATARDPAKADALNALAAEKGNITVLTWRADMWEDARVVKGAIEKQAGQLDVLIANADTCLSH